MIAQDLRAFFQKNRNDWKKYQESVSVISRSVPDAPETALVKSDFKEMYWFDEIVRRLFGGKNLCASADALYMDIPACPDETPSVYLIEFKPFSPDNPEQQQSIKNSLYLKAVESYAVLSRAFFPLCEDLQNPARLEFWIVTNQSDAAVNGGVAVRRKRKSASKGNVSGKKTAQSSAKERLKELRDEVHRLKKEITVNGNAIPYLYDEIPVMEVDAFKKRLERFSGSVSSAEGT